MKIIKAAFEELYDHKEKKSYGYMKKKEYGGFDSGIIIDFTFQDKINIRYYENFEYGNFYIELVPNNPVTSHVLKNNDILNINTINGETYSYDLSNIF